MTRSPSGELLRALLRERFLDIGDRAVDQRLGLFQHDLVAHFLMQQRADFAQRVGIGDQDQPLVGALWARS
nr:hypothetical protein [Sphingopyxis sp. BSNA05]